MIDGVGNEDKEVIGISKAKGSSVDMSFSLLVTLSRYLTQTQKTRILDGHEVKCGLLCPLAGRYFDLWVGCE